MAPKKPAKGLLIRNTEIKKMAATIANSMNKSPEKVIEEILLDHLKRESENIIAKHRLIQHQFLAGDIGERWYGLMTGEKPSKKLIEQKKKMFPEIMNQRFIAGDLTSEDYKLKTGKPPSNDLKDQRQATEMLECWIKAQARQASSLPEQYVNKLANEAIYAGPQRFRR